MKNRALARSIRRMASTHIMPHKDILSAFTWATIYVTCIVLNMEPILYGNT